MRATPLSGGAAAPTGARRRELVERRVGTQPGGPGDRPRQVAQRLARVGGISDDVDRSTGERRGQRLHEATSEREPGRVVAVLSHEPEANRQRDGPVEEPQAHHDRRDHPVVAIADLLVTEGGAVVEPRGRVHLRPGTMEQRVVDGDGDRRVLRRQQAHHEAGKDGGHLLERPAGMGEEPLRPVVAPGLRQANPLASPTP